jgi:hypothetical protein
VGYCPVDGDEYREGIERCLVHDVDLVDDPPEVERTARWFDRLNSRAWVRVAFWIMVVASLLYAVFGAIASLLFASAIAGGDTFTAPEALAKLSQAAFPVALGAFGVIAAAALTRTYSEGIRPTTEAERPEDAARNRLRREVMRVLFALTVVFTLMWVVTGVLTTTTQTDSAFGVLLQLGAEKPDDWLITLFNLNTLSYYGGVACFAIMGATLLLAAYDRISTRNDAL